MRTYRILRLIFMLLLFCLVACSKVDSDIKKPSTTPTPNAPTINIENDIIINGLSFSAEEGEESITVSTDADWTLSIAQTRNIDWCTSSVTSGKKGTATVYFSVKENTGYDNRRHKAFSSCKKRYL